MSIRLIESSNENDHFKIAYNLSDTLVAAISADNPSTHLNLMKIGHLQLQNIGIDACMRVLTFENGNPTKFSLKCAVGDWSSKLNKDYLALPLPYPTYNILNTPRNYEIIMQDFGKNFNMIFNAPKNSYLDNYGHIDLDRYLNGFFTALKLYLK